MIVVATARTFDIKRPFVALAPFLHDDRRYAAGDRFPWRDLGISERKLLAMWGAYLVGNAPPPAKAKAKRATAEA